MTMRQVIQQEPSTLTVTGASPTALDERGTPSAC